MKKLIVAMIAGAYALSASAGAFLDSLANSPHKVNSSSYATGGDIILHLNGAGYDDYVHIFTNTAASAQFTPSANLHARLLVIAGGGSGGGCNNSAISGGGGAGGLIYENDIVLVGATGYNVTVGAGGTGVSGQTGGNNGKDTTFIASDSSLSLTAVRGGGGGGWYNAPKTGGSGGGGSGGQNSTVYAPASGTDGQGHAGGAATPDACGGGGGGAGEPGHAAVESPYALRRAGDGGDGLAFDITGTMEYYAGGGGAGGGSYPNRAKGGLGGGGDGATSKLTPAFPGEDGKGGGGGGIIVNGVNSGKGGDGIVIVRYCAYAGNAPLVRPCSVEVTGTSSADVAGAIASMGADAVRATVTMTLTPKDNADAVEKTFTLATVEGAALTADQAFTYRVEGLAAATTYDYIIRATNDKNAETQVQQGEITTHSASFVATVTGDGVEVKKIGSDTAIIFTADGTLTLDGMGCAQVLVVGGGGGGGSVSGGGGGGGGVYYNRAELLNPGTYAVKVGAGGKGATGGTYVDNNTAGEGSSLVGAGMNIAVLGGGRGARWDGSVAGNGGCGGGAAGNRANGYGTLNQNQGYDCDMQGYDGGVMKAAECSRGSGGGGATANGQPSNSTSAGDGGAGLLVDITGEELDYGSGGGGGCSVHKGNTGPGGAGGGAGAGRGANSAVSTDTSEANKPGNGLNGRGGGGGGGNGNKYDEFYSGSGGSGVVIVRFPGEARFTVKLNPNGGTAGGTTEVTATPGEPMPTIAREDLPTRDGFVFAGYSREGWEVTRMTGKETDVLVEGDGIWAYSAKESYTINGVAFATKLVASSRNIGDGAMSVSKAFDFAGGTSMSEDTTGDYAKLMNNMVRMDSSTTDFILTISNLLIGASYAVQIVHHCGDATYRDLSVDGGQTYYSRGAGTGTTESVYGWSFVKRFVATRTTETIALKSQRTYIQINAIQLRKLSDDASGFKYYNSDGSSARNYPLNNIPTELFAMWDKVPLTASLSSSAVAATSATVTLDVSSLGDETDLRAVLRWGTTENCTEGAKILGAVAVGTPLVENLTGLVPGTNYHAKVEFVREDHSRVASANVQPISFATPAVAASAYADILSVTGAARSERLDDGSLLYVFTDTNAAHALSFTVAKGGLARLLVVGGGGAGGFYGYHAATGGGGGGAVIDQVLELESGTYNVTVGAGGVFDDASINSKWSTDNETHYNGSPSSVRLDGASDDVLSALGGGGGGNMDGDGGEGANGGGGSVYHCKPTQFENRLRSGNGGSGKEGFDGGAAWGQAETFTGEPPMHMGGGGGGAGGFGGSVTDENGRGIGGIGLYSTIFDLPEDDDNAWFGGGGAGGAGEGSEDNLLTEAVAGGCGGGASSRDWSGKNALANPGTPGTGGGGSGVVQHFGNSESKGTANGGSGIVVLRIYGNMCVPVALNKNGGTTEPNPATVTATPGQEMPQLEDGQKLTGTRTGYTFMGYGAKQWEARLMIGDEAKDICNEGTPVFAQMKGTAGTLNGVSFTNDLVDDTTKKELQCMGKTWGKTDDGGGNYTNQGKSGTYGDLMKHGVFCDVAGVDTATATVTLKNLTRGHSYLFQFFVHDGRTQSGDLPDRSVSVDQETWYYYGLGGHSADATRGEYGVTFICRFVAANETEDVVVYFKKSPNGCISAQFNAMQLQDITEVNSQIYYNADGTSDKTYPAANGPTELFAIWQPITYTVKFGGDAESNPGAMADLVCTYDVPTNLPPNQLKREYTITLNPNGGSVSSTSLTCSWPFSRWKLDNTHSFANQALVSNLTTVNNGTVWLAPQWNEGRVSLPVPSRDGYVFEGWYDGDTKIGNLDSYMCMEPKTLVAHWSLATYAVNYELNDGTAGTTHPASAMPGTAFEVSAPTKSGCHFIGWKVSGFASGAKWGTSSDAMTTDVTADGLCFNGTSSVWFKSLAAAGGTVTLTAQWRTDVTKPTAATGLVYNGNELTGVEAATGYSVANGKATNAGDYTATATLTDGYCWSDGTTDNASISWSIAKAAIVASAADVEKEYDGVAAHIAVTVTTPASGATVTYCTTSNGVYGANPEFSDFGAHRVYWKVTAANYEEANGSAVVRIGKKAAGEFVRLVITKRKGNGTDNDFQFNELELYEDDSGANCISAGLTLADGLADLKKNAGTCYSFPTNCHGNQAQNASKLFDNDAGSGSKLCCPRNSTSADMTDVHVEIYMHLADASKVIRSYNLKSADDANDCSWRSPTAWRLEVSSDCERWTVIDEKTIDPEREQALNHAFTWYNGGNPYPINLNYVPMEVLETNPCEDTEAYKKVMNYIQIVGFQLDKDNVVTTRVQYNGTNSGSWDSLFCQRDLKGYGSFAVHRQSSGDNSPRLRFDYGSGKASVLVQVTGDYKFVASASGGLVTNDSLAVATAPCTWTSLPDNSLLLFASDSASACDGIPVQNWTYLKCYYFQVAESATDSTLRLDLVPASNTVSHAQGLYDRVSGNFYPLQDGGVAGKTLSGSNTQVTFSKELAAVKDEDGWDQFPLVTEVAYSGTYLTSITNYWQQEWVPAAVTGAGEYRLVMRGQGPYKGAVANVYTVRARVALDANGGTAGATNSVLVLPGKALPNITGAGALPTRVGHVFAGYFDDATGTKYYNADGTCVTGVTYPMADGPTALMAHWLVDLAQAKVLTTAVPVSPWPPTVTVEVGDGSLTRVSTGFAVTSDPVTPVVGGSCTLTLTGDGVTCTGTQTATVRVNPAAPEVVAGATMWFDAADAAKLTLSTEAITADEIALGEGVTFVTNWMKSAGDVDHMSALTNYYGKSSGDAVGWVRKGNRPTLGTMPNGNHYLDFGSVLNIAKAAPMPSGYGAGMGWFDENGNAIGRNDIQDVYMVVMDDEGCNARRSDSCQYQHFLGTANEDGTATSFLRLKDYGYVLGDGDISSNKADDSFLNGTISIDGLSAGVRTIYPPGFHVLRLASDGGAGSAGALCSNESDAQGGLKYGELIVFDKVQSDADAAAIIDYLYEKWLGTAPRNDIRIRLDNSAIAAEKITDGYVVCRNGGAMQELPVKYVDNNSPVTTFVRGTFVGYYDANGVKYYGKDGLPVSGRETCAFTADTTLYAHYAYILPAIRADGPTVEVETGWMKSLCPDATSVNDYKSAFLEPNGNGVKVWQAYVLGHEPGEVNGAKIVEETAQNANPETVTIRLCGLPESPRTNATTRLAYSLYAARTTEAFAKGEDALVEKNGDTTPFKKSEKSTFEAPLSDLTDAEPVNYYRIRVHFIFDGGK